MTLESHISKRRIPQFYRDPKAAMLGGVCAGIAEALNNDALLVRVAAVALAFSTFGLATVLYMMLWMLLPAKSAEDGFIDVEPSRVQSEFYDKVVNVRLDRVQAEKPEVKVIEVHPKTESPAYSAGGFSAYKLSILLLVLLCALLSVAIAFVDMRVDDFEFAEFWPLYFIPLGIFVVTLPSPTRTIATRLSMMFICFEFCAIALPFSLGLCSFSALSTLGPAAFMFWFVAMIVLMAAGVFENTPCYMISVILILVAACWSFYDFGLFDPEMFFTGVDPELAEIIRS